MTGARRLLFELLDGVVELEGLLGKSTRVPREKIMAQRNWFCGWQPIRQPLQRSVSVEYDERKRCGTLQRPVHPL